MTVAELPATLDLAYVTNPSIVSYLADKDVLVCLFVKFAEVNRCAIFHPAIGVVSGFNWLWVPVVTVSVNACGFSQFDVDGRTVKVRVEVVIKVTRLAIPAVGMNFVGGVGYVNACAIPCVGLVYCCDWLAVLA